VLNEHLKADIEGFAKSRGFPPSVPIVAASVALFYRYHNDGADAALILDMIDRSRHSVSLSIPCSGSVTFAEICRDTNHAMRTATTYQDTLQEVHLEWNPPDMPAGDHAVEIAVNYGGSSVEVCFSCRADSMFSEVVESSGVHFEYLLRGCAAKPEIPCKDCTLISGKEWALLEKFSGDQHDPAEIEPRILHRIFEETAAKYPDAIAVSCNGMDLSYAQVNEQANRLADYLRSRGVGRASFVGLLFPRSSQVYGAILAVLKAGAAYVPLDPHYPADRIRFIIEDSKAAILLTTADLAKDLCAVSCPVIAQDEDISYQSMSDENLPCDAGSAPGDDPAYVIYTSGTTGKPKGVIVPHRCVCALVAAEKRLFEIQPSDRIFQGFSVAFDASIEELWLAFANGAALIVGTEEVVHAGAGLSEYLIEQNVTVLSCVPTMLSMMTEDVPCIRLLIVGGEACPQELVNRWSTQARRMVNTYGPTEATVIATAAECSPSRPVTIGRPIPYYSVYILDRFQNPLPKGLAGELCIGGAGVTVGYLGRSDLTNQKFVTPLFPIRHNDGGRIYRSGDLARFDATGNIEYLGRIDAQVKLRGFRVELEEIESQIMLAGTAKAAAVTVREDIPGMQTLVAYVVPVTAGSFDEAGTKARLRAKLAPYMVPGIFEVVDDFPRLSSGKINRKLLPVPRAREADPEKSGPGPRTGTEKRIHAIWSRLFSPTRVSINEDFFDLGGHSLIAAQLVSELRTMPGSRKISVRDVYEHRTIERLALHIDTMLKETALHESPTATRAEQAAARLREDSARAYRGCGSAQAMVIAVQYCVAAGLLLTPAIAWHRELRAGLLDTVFGGLLILLAYAPVSMAVAIAAKWCIIGRFKTGTYPLWGSYYFRIWLLGRFTSLVPTGLLGGTPFLCWYCRLMGARVGRNVYLGSNRLGAYDLISISDNASISREAYIMGYTVEESTIRLGPISIGNNCSIGPRSALGEHTVMENGSQLAELSMLPAGMTVPHGQWWKGSPAKPDRSHAVSKDSSGGEEVLSQACPASLHILIFASAFAFVLLVPPMLIAPFGFFIFETVRSNGMVGAAIATIAASAGYTILFALFTALVKRLVLGAINPGKFSVRSILYIRKWVVDTFMQMSLQNIQPVYATLYLPSWLRLLGAHIGKRTEISTVNQMTTDMLTIGDESFLADSASVGAPLIRNGYMHALPTAVGKRTFIGNSAVLATGTSVGDGCLIGVLSTAPANDAGPRDNSSWLGSPPMFLPKRQESAQYSSRFTYAPPWYLFLARGSIEFLKITMPAAIGTIGIILFYAVTSGLIRGIGEISTIVLSPFLLVACVLLGPLAAIVAKWAIVGKYRPQHRPLWSTFVWRNEFINSLCENLVYPTFVAGLLGTPFAPFFFRLMGCRIGKRVYMATTEITEFDLVRIGDDTAINIGSTLQTHLFEDRVMKMSLVRIGESCTVGPMSVVLYDSIMEDGARLDALSLLMKGELLPASTHWEGSPAHRVTSKRAVMS